tara:strand:- start:2617 stop:3768 length:1152 start_codon:yes stop_codon:yes gene_type:complete
MKLIFLPLIKTFLSGPGSLPPIGNVMDEHNCLISAGYTFCEETNNCIRQWETPCSDNYNDCNDCLTKQRNGINIACPDNCVEPELPIPIVDPLPPIAIDPPVCSDVMCMMYCPYGNRLDQNNCPLCECNERTQVNRQDCPIIQPSCDNYVYLCPKLTEITNCNKGGIDGYTTFQLSVIIKDNTNVKNIFALFGDNFQEMYLPPVYQSSEEIGSNIGGFNELMYRYNSDVRYDSWLTIGITNGDQLNQLSSIGIDFHKWTETEGIEITDGAVFVMDPQQVIVTGNEYIIGQLTVRTGTDLIAIFNIEGKTLNTDISERWSEYNVEFPLITPTEVIHNNIPEGCISWNDGCNTCNVINGNLGSCTKLMCFTESIPRCLRYSDTGH